MLSDYQKALAELAKIPAADFDAFPAERCSDPTQAHGSTWFRQDLITRGAIGSKGWNYRGDAPVIDNGKSAFHEENFGPKAQLMIFLAAAKAGKIRAGRTILVFAHENRFTRAKIFNGKTKLKEMTDNGIYVYFANSDLLLVPGWENDASIDTRLTTAFDFARREIQDRQQYVLYSILKKIGDLEAGVVVNTGKYPWWIMFVGLSNKLPGKYDKSDELVFPNTDNPMTWWDVAVRIKEAALTDATLLTIVTDLNNAKIPCPNGGRKWGIGHIRRLLKSKLFLGIATFGGGKRNGKHIKGTKEFQIYPPIATFEEWSQIQHRFAKCAGRKGPNALSGGVNTLFMGRATCSACGGSLVARARYPIAKYGSKHYENPLYRQYYCRNHADNGSCSVSVGLPISPLEIDFCLNYLQQDLNSLLQKDDDDQIKLIRAQTEKVSAFQAVVDGYQAALKEANNETARKAVMALLNPAGVELEEAQRILERIPRPIPESNAPKALNATQEALRGIDADPANPEAWRRVELTLALAIEQLSDPGARSKLAALIPDFINGIVVDLEKQSYAVKNLQGKNEPMRDLSVAIAAIRKDSYLSTSQIIWASRRKNGTASGYTFKRKKVLKNGLTVSERVLAGLSKLKKPATIKLLKGVCKMGYYHLVSALKELSAQGKVEHTADGYRLKRS